MKLLFVVLSCVLTLAFHLSSHPSTDDSSFSQNQTAKDQILGRRLMKEPSFSSSTPAGGHDEAETVGRMEGLEVEGGLTSGKHNIGDEDDLIYNMDYHGVTTHPSPLPKHPKP